MAAPARTDCDGAAAFWAGAAGAGVGQTELSDPCGGAPDFGLMLIRVGGFWLPERRRRGDYHDQSARMYLNALGQAGYEMLVLDEAHKLRNLYGANQAPQVAQQFREVLANRMFKYVLMLTATPIHNRLWDIYSLVDLLAVARGHQNPFGTEGIFARTFIADGRMEARHLNPQMREAFRSVVYGYMSRIRRADANLHFPERIVQLHRVNPSAEELELIRLIAGPIQNLNRLSQISILQALISSPHALLAQLKQMARNRVFPTGSRRAWNKSSGESVTPKLQGLGTLVDQLKAEQPERWRVVVFTMRRETQTTIEAFLGGARDLVRSHQRRFR